MTLRGRADGKIFAERMTAEFDGDFVVLLIGMRVNRLPVFLAMPETARSRRYGAGRAMTHSGGSERS